MLVAELLGVLERMAPVSLAQPGDNSGLLVGDERAPVRRALAALELTRPVLDEAVAGGFDTILTHHPLLFSPVRALVESDPRASMLRSLAAEHMTLISCHTNLDAAPGGLAEIAGQALGLLRMAPLQPASTGWYKLVGFIPGEAVEKVAAAVFATGAGGIGRYSDCAFAASGTGWFTPGPGSHPTIGQESRPERTPEVRWETVVPRARLGEAIRAFVGAHPYEEPAFDIYPVEDVLPHVGLGRVGVLPGPTTVRALAERCAEAFGTTGVSFSGEGDRLVSRVGVLPGSGRGLLDAAGGQCEALVTGDLSYHDAERAEERGVSLIDVPHGEFEWWAFRRWVESLTEQLGEPGVTLSISEKWGCPWSRLSSGEGCCDGATAVEKPEGGRIRLWIDGGSRGNPGLSAIGVVLERADGTPLDSVSRVIGVATNNVAEYRALLAGLDLAKRLEAREVEVLSDSELLVKQMRGEYKVKNEGLKPLHAEARDRARCFRSFAIRHVEREQNSAADGLVNRALDEHEKAGL